MTEEPPTQPHRRRGLPGRAFAPGCRLHKGPQPAPRPARTIDPAPRCAWSAGAIGGRALKSKDRADTTDRRPKQARRPVPASAGLWPRRQKAPFPSSKSGCGKNGHPEPEVARRRVLPAPEVCRLRVLRTSPTRPLAGRRESGRAPFPRPAIGYNRGPHFLRGDSPMRSHSPTANGLRRRNPAARMQAAGAGLSACPCRECCVPRRRRRGGRGAKSVIFICSSAAEHQREHVLDIDRARGRQQDGDRGQGAGKHPARSTHGAERESRALGTRWAPRAMVDKYIAPREDVEDSLTRLTPRPGGHDLQIRPEIGKHSPIGRGFNSNGATGSRWARVEYLESRSQPGSENLPSYDTWVPSRLGRLSSREQSSAPASTALARRAYNPDEHARVKPPRQQRTTPTGASATDEG